MAARLAGFIVVAIVTSTVIAGLIVGAQRDDNSGPVDLIVHNAKVYAADDLGTMAEAVAIRGNKLLKVGSEREVMRYRKPQTTVIDAKGAAVLPGFDDAHASLVAGGLSREAVQLFGAATLDDIRARIEAWVAARPDAPWVTGVGWSIDSVSEPTRAQLDAIVSDRPARLLSQDGQTLWVNSQALALAGIARRTAAPAHGAILRDRRGDPTGVLKGTAIALIDKAAPKPTREERAKALQLAIRDAQRQGITSAHDLGASPGDMDLYDAAREAGLLGLRVYAAVQAERTAAADLDAIAKRYPDDPLLKTGLATIAFDGSVESQTAAMLSPYAPRGSGDGDAAMTPEQLAALVAALDTRGWQVAIDAAGDRAVRAALDAVAAAARSGQAKKAPRHRIEGVATVAAEDIPRFGALGVIASLQPLHATGDALLTWSRNLGPERAALGWPARSLSAAGAHLTFGTDWPRLPLAPLDGLRAAVRRPDLHAPEQLTLKSAINGWTSGGAWASFDEHRKGRLRAEMLADLVVLSNDIFASAANLAAAEVVMTIFDGKIVYRRPS
ncbi:MAG TPA: amidohydrolase [Vicinamibacterales bacterium]|nr:amidohydrolase [Vicinamibacterales bacterium]